MKIDPAKRHALLTCNLNNVVVSDHDRGVRGRGAIEGAFYLDTDAQAMCDRLNDMYQLADGFVVVDLNP